MVQNIEAVAFVPATYYDMLHYMTNQNKLKVCQGGLKWLTLTPHRSVIKLRIRMRPKVKRMVKKSFFGCLVGCPKVGTREQYHIAADTTDLAHVRVDYRIRYNEWSKDFNMRKV